MIRITGDINLTDGYFDVGFGVGSKLAQGFNPFHSIDRNGDDLWVGNFEGVTADVSEKTGTASRQFRVLPQHIKHLHHPDIYGLANNHAMQHGDEAYWQSVKTLEEQGCKVFGTNEHRTAILQHQGRTISITGFSQRIDAWSKEPLYWHNPECADIQKELEQLPDDAYKIVYVHWGNEFINYPSSQQKKFAHWLIDVGYDLIIGMHPHVLQGYEIYKDKFIFYSLGNFVFDMAWEPTHYGAIVNVDFAGAQPKISYDYVKIGEDYSPKVINEAEVPKQYRFGELNKLITIEDNSEEYHNTIHKFYRQYRKANHKDILKKMFRHPYVTLSIIKDFIKRRF